MNIYNFSPGPAMIPEEVVAQTREEGFDFCRLGISVMETSHRSPEFEALALEMENDLCALMNIPDSHAVLFLQGGARTQFAMAPLNLIGKHMEVDYFDTGIWSQGAIEEARRYAKVNIVASAQSSEYLSIPSQETWRFSNQAAYVHYTTNETVNGLQFKTVPVTQKPLVADMSSDILSYPLDVSRFGLIYAAAQKNIGPAGLTLVIVNKSILQEPPAFTPTILRYDTHLKTHSLYNTCPTFSWYVTSRVIKWIMRQGGTLAMAERNTRKAQKLYDFIDASDFYHNFSDKTYRSTMNVIFHLAKPELTVHFAESAKEAGLYGLLGHPKLGGLRASLYNAMPEAGVDVLLEFMEEFQKQYF